MRDLAGDADTGESTPPRFRLGGGNPAAVPAAMTAFRRCFTEFAGVPGQIEHQVAEYPSPQGHMGFIDALVRLFREQFGWPIGRMNIALTNGSQNAFFMLFNLLAGPSDGEMRRILLPMAPEYIGYGDVGITGNIFHARRPRIELLDDVLFKYHPQPIDTPLATDIGAICVSRPTNPTGNVLTDDELDKLDQVALDAGVPLIIDNAYGAPFPNIINVPATLRWHGNIVLSMSLSKIGFPAARTGILVANEDIIAAVIEMNAVYNLAPGGLAPAVLAPLFASGEILEISRRHLQPFYHQRASDALSWCRQAFVNVPARVHQPEGSIFLWLWFPQLSISVRELYWRLKHRGVVVVPGHYFFPGLEGDWEHRDQCIRVNVAGDPLEIRGGLDIIADEVLKASGQND